MAGRVQADVSLPLSKQSSYGGNKFRDRTYSGVSRRKKSMSMAAEKAANASPPPKAAFGPELRARTPPAKKPEATELYMSFFARYYNALDE